MDSLPVAGNVGHTILLGGIGGDSHSVGLTILRQALSQRGYRVRYLGTQNCLEDFFRFAALSNVVMISSLDGHTRYYVREFPELMNRYSARKPLWYLGGNLHIGDAQGYERYFVEMGFDRVFVKFVDITTVLSLLEKDLNSVEPLPECPTLWGQANPSASSLAAQVSDEVLDSASFERDRAQVLQAWKTGIAARSLEDNARFLVGRPSFPKAQALTNDSKQPVLLQPRSGVPEVEKQIKLFKVFKSVGARVLSYQVDSLTRNNNYSGADEAIRESYATGISTLNGFPVINHGVGTLRRIISEVKSPLQTRHSTRDPRLLAEISYAGGVTAFEGGAICYNIPYYKNYPLDQSIKAWQYVDRLTGIYSERFGVTLDREFFGTLTATLIPPSLAISVNIIEAILAVCQGVKCVSLGYAEQGNRIQDVAAIRTLGLMGREVLSSLGYKDVQVNTVYHQYMAAFPEDERRAEELIYNSAVTGALSRATRVIVKTPAEAYKIPTLRDNVHAMNIVTRAVSEAPRESINEALVDDECSLIRREVQSILDSVVVCGHGSIAEGVITAFRKGYIDIPFSPSVHNAGEVMTARDTSGAVRFFSFGNLQFDREVREFHESKTGERRRAEGLRSKKEDYLLVERDVMQIPRGQYDRWPLYDGAAIDSMNRMAGISS